MQIALDTLGGTRSFIARCIALTVSMAISLSVFAGNSDLEAPIISQMIVGASASESVTGIVVNRCSRDAELIVVVTPYVVQPTGALEEAPVTMPLHLLAGEAETFDVVLPLPPGRRYSTVEVRAMPGECTAPGLYLIELAAVVLNQTGGTSGISRGFGFHEPPGPHENALTPLGAALSSSFYIGEGEAAEVAVANNCASDIVYTFMVTNLGGDLKTYNVDLAAGERQVIPLNQSVGKGFYLVLAPLSRSVAAQCLPEQVVALNTYSIGDGGTVTIGLLLPAVQKVRPRN